MYRITVIEDDDAIYSLLARSLSEWGFEVMRVTDYGNAPEQLLSQMPKGGACHGAEDGTQGEIRKPAAAL